MYLNGILIVEGKDDESLIKSFLEVHVFKTNGFDIKDEDILFLKQVEKIHKIIILSDPDDAGNMIREKLNNNLSNTYNVFIDKKYCDKNGKHGVAESEKKYILEALKEHITLESPKIGNLTKNDLNKLGLNGDSNSKRKREQISIAFSLGVCNGKTILERLNLLSISYEEIRKELEKNGN